MKTLLLGLLPVWLFLAAPQPVSAYNTLDFTWIPGSQVVLQLGLGPTNISLQDGAASWNASAADAVDIWNGYLDFINVSSVSSPTVPQASGDGVNSVFFASTIFGDRFDEGTLAITLLRTDGEAGSHTGEADVVVNTAFRYDSYRGPEQSDVLGSVYDLHRILLHEFGHVLGLDHVTNDPPGQALMEPIISDLDHLASDDIAGMQFLYGAVIYSGLGSEPVVLRTGDPYVLPFSLLHPNNNVTSYSVDDLPPGLTFNPATNEISGNVASSGNFGAVITAHGPIANAYAVLTFTVLGVERVQGLQAILHTSGYRMVPDPIRPRIYTGGTDGIKMIDANTFAIADLVTETDSISNLFLSVSADGSKLLFTRSTESPPQLNRIDLESLALLPPLPIPANTSAVQEGLEDRDYVSDSTGVYQFSRATGNLQTFFASTGQTNGFPQELAVSPDRATLYVTSLYDQGLHSYDISGPEPILLASLPGSLRSPICSPDGQYLYYTSGDVDSSGQLIRATLPGLSPRIAFTSSNFDATFAVGVDGAIYKSGLPDTLSAFQLYDPVSLQPTASIDLYHFDPFSYYIPGQAAFDAGGNHLFVSAGGIAAEVWVFSSDPGSDPPPVLDPSRNLLNISTRARVQTGENEMIGGFIVQGPEPKRVLIRGTGPSLPLDATLSNPILDLYDGTGKLIGSNDNWISDRISILGSGLPPSSEREATILITLDPGAYTAILRDTNARPGLALVEVYDLEPADSLLANISTRGKVETGDNVMIGGFIIGGTDSTQVLIRAIGPSLAGVGVQAPLSDPVLELHDASGKLVSSNDNWRSTQQSEIVATGLPPENDAESAILTTLQPGGYTAIVRGQDETSGVALVDIYNLGGASTTTSALRR